jgi:hypothetical protein
VPDLLVAERMGALLVEKPPDRPGIRSRQPHAGDSSRGSPDPTVAADATATHAGSGSWRWCRGCTEERRRL